MRVRRFLPLLLLAVATLLIALPARNANASAAPALQSFQDGSVAKNFIAALNSGNQSRAISYLAADFSLTMADGTMYTGVDAQNALLSLTTPITIVQLAPQGNRLLDVAAQFGNGPTVWVQFTGEGGGMIGTMTIYPAAGS